MLPEGREFFVGDQRDVGLGKMFTEPGQCRGHHDGIAEPIDATDEDALRDAVMGWEGHTNLRARVFGNPAGSAWGLLPQAGSFWRVSTGYGPRTNWRGPGARRPRTTY